jgi:hypothetical protein
VWESHFVFFPNYPGRLEGDWNSRGLAPQEVWIITQIAPNCMPGGFPMSRPSSRFWFFTAMPGTSPIARRSTIPAGHAGKCFGRGISWLRTQRRIAERIRSVLGCRRRVRISRIGQKHPATSDRVFWSIQLAAPFPSASRVASKIFPFLRFQWSVTRVLSGP